MKRNMINYTITRLYLQNRNKHQGSSNNDVCPAAELLVFPLGSYILIYFCLVSFFKFTYVKVTDKI